MCFLQNFLQILGRIRSRLCQICKLYLLFLVHLNLFEPFHSQKFYDKFDEAYQAARDGTILGFLHISKNFSSSLPLFEVNLTAHQDAAIQVYIDNTDFYKSMSVRDELQLSFRRFMKGLMKDCKLPEKLFNPLIICEKMLGTLGSDLRKYFGLGYIVA